MYCSQCGREARPGARFCAGCGTPLPTGRSQAEVAHSTSYADGSVTEPIVEKEQSALRPEIGPPDGTEAGAGHLDRSRATERPASDLYHSGARKSLRTLTWLGILGAVVATTAAIGGYLYMARPMEQTPETQQDREPVVPAPQSVPSAPSPSSVGDSPAQASPDAAGPTIPNDGIQEADATQILALTEYKVSEATRRAAESGPPRRGDRKTARAANGRGLGYLQAGQIPEAISAFQEAHQADPARCGGLEQPRSRLSHGSRPGFAERHILATLVLVPQRAAAWSDLGQVYGKKGVTKGAVASFANAYRFSQNKDKTHEFFRGLMEKDDDPNLKQALQQVTRLAETDFLVKPAQ